MSASVRQHNAFRRVADKLNAMNGAEFLQRLNAHSGKEFSLALLETAQFLSTQPSSAFEPAVELRHGKAALVPLSTEHAVELLHNWGQDPSTFEHLSSAPVNTPEIMDTVINKSKRAWQDGTFFRYTLLTPEHHPIGLVTLTPHTALPGMIEFGLSIGSAFWHQGYGFNALQACLSSTRQQATPFTLFATCLPGSPGHALMKKAGFVEQGMLPRRAIYGACTNPDATCSLYTSE